MNPLIKFLLFLVLICLGQNAFGTEIINGDKAANSSLQFMAFLEGNRRMCGGFLISEDFVMSAAHCAGKTKVILGAHDLKKLDQSMIYAVEKEYVHPDFASGPPQNDIMLLKLSRRAQLGKNIKLVKIPTHPTAPRANQMCTAAGWGRTTPDGNTADELLFVNVPVIDQEVCNREWNRRLPPKVICAGGYKTEKGVCKGDSGGPLVCNGVAVGISSFVQQFCPYPGRPNVFTDISKFLPWINNILRK